MRIKREDKQNGEHVIKMENVLSEIYIEVSKKSSYIQYVRREDVGHDIARPW